MYEPRFYREWVEHSGLITFQVTERETDLQIHAHRDLSHRARDVIHDVRGRIEARIARQPEFAESLSPLPMPPDAVPIVAAMIEAARAFDVGPMAAVAGAVAQFVGEALLAWTPEIIVENGGDIFLKMDRPAEIGLYAGADSPFSGEIRLRIDPEGRGLGVCTSSGTVGHSASFGRADAVVAVSPNTALADAAATAIGNRVRSPDDVERVLNEEHERGLLDGLLIAVGKRIGAWGRIELVR